MIKLFLSHWCSFCSVLIVVPFWINAGLAVIPMGYLVPERWSPSVNLFASLSTCYVSVSERVWFRIIVIAFQVIS